jgi:glucose/arabinose dehydrogenase
MKLNKKSLAVFSLFFLARQASSVFADTAIEESQYYQILTLPIPEGVILETGALQVMPDGQLAVSTRIGDIYLVEGAFGNPPAGVKYHPYASGLHEVLGLTLRDGWLYATQRGEVTRMKDLDGDHRADLFETVSDDWGITGDYHEYAFGSKFDKDGYIWVTLTLTGSFTSETEFRGWCMRISPDGKTIPTCSGLRSPGGIGTNSVGDMFFSENQGPWNGSCALKHLTPGAFVGNPSGNIWYKLTTALGKRPQDPQSGSRMHIEARKIPELLPPAVLFPYPQMGQSASGIACDGSSGKFGPFSNQLFVGDQTHSTVMRVYLEKVNGRYQGACFPFRQGFASGNLSLEFAPDGSLFVGGTDRGWGARGGKPFALQRLIWTGKVPFEIREMRAKSDGFELTFTQPIDSSTAADPASYRMETYTYIYQSNYGSPEVDKTTPLIKRVTVAKDGLSIRLAVDGLQEGHVHELHLAGVCSAKGEALLHPVAYYTINYIPAGKP